jgi:hypothetical protein
LVKIERMLNRFIPQGPSISKLSKLQKRILEEGLKAHWREPILRAWGSDTPGRFGISKVLEEFFGADKEDIERPYARRLAPARSRLARKRLAARHAAVSRAIRRLVKRGLLEKISPTRRSGWRLTACGVEAASSVCPTPQEPDRVHMIQRIKEIFAERKTSRLCLPLSAEVTLDDFIASVLPGRNSSSHKLRKSKAREGVKVAFVGLE